MAEMINESEAKNRDEKKHLQDKIINLEYNVNIADVILPEEVDELCINMDCIITLENLPKKIGLLSLNLSQKNWEKSQLPDNVETLIINGNRECIIDKFPKYLKRLEVNNVKELKMEFVPMIKELNIHGDCENICLDFLPNSLQKLSLSSWGRKRQTINLINLPSGLRTLELDGVFYENIPDFIQELVLKNVIPDDEDMKQITKRDKLDISFCGAYLDCCLKIENVNDVYVYSSGGIREVICNGEKYEYITKLKICGGHVKEINKIIK